MARPRADYDSLMVQEFLSFEQAMAYCNLTAEEMKELVLDGILQPHGRRDEGVGAAIRAYLSKQVQERRLFPAGDQETQVTTGRDGTAIYHMMVVLGRKGGSSSEGRVPLEVAGSSPTCRTKTIFEKLNLPHYLPNRVSKIVARGCAALFQRFSG